MWSVIENMVGVGLSFIPFMSPNCAIKIKHVKGSNLSMFLVIEGITSYFLKKVWIVAVRLNLICWVTQHTSVINMI